MEPQVDTHFTLRQFIPVNNAGFKKDWGISLNGSPPKFDYEISLTRGTGVDLTGTDVDPFLVAGRIGTPSDKNVVVGLSALYGEVVSDMPIHRVDHNDPRGEAREADGFVRRLRVGVDSTLVFDQFTWRSEVSGGDDFEQQVFNALTELNWTSVDDVLSAYMQWLYLGQNGHLGWDENVIVRIGGVWHIDGQLEFSGYVSQDIQQYAENLNGGHLRHTTIVFQLRKLFR